MIIERAELSIHPGRETEFESAMVRGCALLAGAHGCKSVALARGVERPSHYLLTLQWDSVDDHIAFTKTADLMSFRELAGPYFAEKPAMEHFAPVHTLD